ncbi:hypothetical protein K474DRAFT_945428 [Panus rudis PR-1116 ss-1]|nr:hypothetical protein K474DRAFT_945428 [Panus rudis PR-1116 ss-1]
MLVTGNTSRVAEDPGASGWAEGTWAKSEEPVHPSLASPPSRKAQVRAVATSPSTSSHWSDPSTDSGYPDRSNTTSPSRSTVATIATSSPPGTATYPGNKSPTTIPLISHAPHPFAIATPAATPVASSFPTSSRSQPGQFLSADSASSASSRYPPSRSDTVPPLPSFGRGGNAITTIPEGEAVKGDEGETSWFSSDVDEDSRPPSYRS